MPRAGQPALRWFEIRLGPQDLREFVGRLGSLFLKQVSLSEVIAGFEVIGLEAQGILKGRNRLGQLALPRQSVPEVVVQSGIIGGGLERRLKMDNRLFRFPFRQQQIAQVVMGLGVIGVDPQRFEVSFFALSGSPPLARARPRL